MPGKKQTGKTAVLHRLNRIEGQVKGLHRMVEEEKNCLDVFTQVAAVKAAVESVGMMMLENYMKTCMCSAGGEAEMEKKAQQLTTAIRKFIRSVD